MLEAKKHKQEIECAAALVAVLTRNSFAPWFPAKRGEPMLRS